MSDLNDLKLYGRIVKDAVIKQKDEQQLAFFTIAVNETKKDSGTDSSGKRLYDSRIYISVKKIQIIFTGKKEDSFQQNEPNIPEDFVVDTDIPNDDLLISEDIPEIF